MNFQTLTLPLNLDPFQSTPHIGKWFSINFKITWHSQKLNFLKLFNYKWYFLRSIRMHIKNNSIVILWCLGFGGPKNHQYEACFHLCWQFVQKYPNENLHQLLALHIQFQIFPLDANNDGISKAYYIRIVHHIPQQDSHFPHDQLKNTN